jgi:ABC-2 type transport system permease protein
MRSIIAIARRELDAYFAWPLVYVTTAVTLAIFGYFFATLLSLSREASLRPLFSQVTVVLAFAVPLLTMRLLAGERRSGTIELLLTSPIREGEVILGKFLAGLGIFALLLTPTLYYVVTLTLFGRPDAGPIVSLYLGLLLLGAALLSLGILASALTDNPTAAAILGLGFTLTLWLLPIAGGFVEEPWRGALTYPGVSAHLSDFLKGVIDTRDVVYYLSVTAGALFLAARLLQHRRWR